MIGVLMATKGHVEIGRACFGGHRKPRLQPFPHDHPPRDVDGCHRLRGVAHNFHRQLGQLAPAEVILWAVRWYLQFPISYRDLERMLGERGVEVDHTTIYRWTERYAPELEKRSAWYRSRLSFSWRVDETYVRVKGRCKYLYCAIDKDGATLDFDLADRRNTKAAKRFLGAALKRSRDWLPRVINTDKNPAYSEAIAELKKEGVIPKELEHRQVKYLNNRIESDHGKLRACSKANMLICMFF
jgi:transposase, IS6 family